MASVRLLQGVGALVVVAAVIATLVVAYDHQPPVVSTGVTALTALGALTASLSYRDMLRSWAAASAHLRRELEPEPR